MKEKYIRYLEKENKYLVSIRTRKYTLFSKRTSSIEEAISVRNKAAEQVREHAEPRPHQRPGQYGSDTV